ncbi:MAG: hypothetical protein KGJ62_05775 [Armatimonadetes bacterium]|nr:hypothetical protein [Armatimonadota bacterium]MDE2206003.1 hypothetical protein [Armatimonadota bacterium]
MRHRFRLIVFAFALPVMVSAIVGCDGYSAPGPEPGPAYIKGSNTGGGGYDVGERPETPNKGKGTGTDSVLTGDGTGAGKSGNFPGVEPNADKKRPETSINP